MTIQAISGQPGADPVNIGMPDQNHVPAYFLIVANNLKCNSARLTCLLEVGHHKFNRFIF